MRIPTWEEIRQICGQRFSPEVYEKMQAASAAIAGLGGLGSNIAVMLARTGIGKLKLIDFDRVDLSNLNRQVYDIRHLGRKKTEALAGNQSLSGSGSMRLQSDGGKRVRDACRLSVHLRGLRRSGGKGYAGGAGAPGASAGISDCRIRHGRMG